MKTIVIGVVAMVSVIALAGCGDKTALARGGGCLAISACGQAAAPAPEAQASPAPGRGIPDAAAVY